MRIKIDKDAIHLICENEDRSKSYNMIFNHLTSDKFWLCTDEGEGMQMNIKDLYKIIDKWYQENF